MARIVTVVVESGKGGFSCFMSKDSDDLNFGIIGDGKTVQAAMAGTRRKSSLRRKAGNSLT